MIVELVWGDGSSSLQNVEFPGGVATTFLRTGRRENEIREIIRRGEAPPTSLFESNHWFFLTGFVAGVAIYKTGAMPGEIEEAKKTKGRGDKEGI